jgi:membrane protease YdiL (CAAX protease family)
LADAALLLWPPMGAIATRLAPEIRDADRTMLATSAAVGVVNATLEEALWRGVYITYWPDDPWLGVVWPALGFGAWHAAPQVIHRSPMGTTRYVIAATALGLSWGWTAWRSRSVRAVLASHAVTDASGVGNARYFLDG